MIVKNLFCAIKTIAAHVLYRIPICGNIHYELDPIRENLLRMDKSQPTLAGGTEFINEYSDYDDELIEP
jgi:hypothetical protein